MVFKSCKATPSTHNENVISCEHSDNIDALGFEFFEFLHVRRNMIYVACRLDWKMKKKKKEEGNENLINRKRKDPTHSESSRD